jgi:hypothetical protein
MSNLRTLPFVKTSPPESPNDGSAKHVSVNRVGAANITLAVGAAGLTGSTESPLSIDARGRHGKRKIPVLSW